jgi:dihydroflavonol-4-reductase
MEKAEAGDIFNLGCRGNFTLMGDLFRLIGRISSVRPPFIKTPLPLTMAYARAITFCADYITHREPVATPANIRILALKRRVDFSKAVRVLGIPQTRLSDIVERTINWYKKEGYA